MVCTLIALGLAHLHAPAVGQAAPAFTATDVSGKTVHFPADFKGRVVLLDFWATWCVPCLGEVPNIRKVYDQLHPKGFEVVGISLDSGPSVQRVAPVAKQKGMQWPQIIDDPKSPETKLYGVTAIPEAFLIDGTSGLILAKGGQIRGSGLLPAVQKALGKAGRP